MLKYCFILQAMFCMFVLQLWLVCACNKKTKNKIVN